MQKRRESQTRFEPRSWDDPVRARSCGQMYELRVVSATLPVVNVRFETYIPSQMNRLKCLTGRSPPLAIISGRQQPRKVETGETVNIDISDRLIVDEIDRLESDYGSRPSQSDDRDITSGSMLITAL